MRCKNNTLYDKNDTKRFYKLTNKNFFDCFKGGIKCLLQLKLKQSKRYFSKANSLCLNKRKNNYPTNLIKNKKRIAVYTALFGDCDEVKMIKKKNPNCDYFIFTDQPIPSNSGWVKKTINYPDEIKDNNALKNRYLKMHPHIIFPEYDYSIYLDAVFVIELDIYRLMARMGNHFIGLFMHHAGINCLYDEAQRVKRIGLAPNDIVDKQMNRYINEGFPKDYGFYECSIIIREHNKFECIHVMDTWWNEIMNESKRDQLSFMYSLWKNGFSKKDVANLGITFWIEPIVVGIGHKKFR